MRARWKVDMLVRRENFRGWMTRSHLALSERRHEREAETQIRRDDATGGENSFDVPVEVRQLQLLVKDFNFYI